ncbi:MAG: HIT family protein [Nanoarchaeota archaeon]
MDCIFCSIISGKIPSAKVAETKNVLAFLDIQPANPGHILIVPKKHVERMDEAENEVFCEMSNLAAKLAKKLMRELYPAGYNILINNGGAAGQEVKHLHLHIIPRYEDDRFAFRWPHKRYGAGEMQALAKRLWVA